MSALLEGRAPARSSPWLDACPGCGGRVLRPLLSQPSIPASSCLMLATPQEARGFPRGAMELAACAACGLVTNRAFDATLTEYSDRYEPTQAWSPTFRRFHRDLAQRVVAAAELPPGATILEAGCGQGEFLHLLCRIARGRGVGLDPSLSATRGAVLEEAAEDVELRAGYFDARSARLLSADLLVCKMTLEHIPDAGGFAEAAATVARNSAPGMRLFVQVPDAARILAEGAFEDIYHEHCHYFTAASLGALFARAGFAVHDISREYAGQYLTLQARFTGEARALAAADATPAEGFAGRVAARIDHWRGLLARRLEAGRRVVSWGSGSKGVSFLTAIGGGAGIAAVVDINPHRQGRFMVGTGHPIVGPDALPALAPATVIVMNAVYRAEVEAALAARGITAEVLAL